MEKRRVNTKNKSQKSSGSSCVPKSSRSFKNAEEKVEAVGSKKVPGKMFKDGNPPGKYKTEKHDYLDSSCESSTQYCESDDESVASTSDFFKPVFEKNKNRNFESKYCLEEITTKERIFSSVNQYKNSKIAFSNIYVRWLPERRNTLKNLQSLLIEIHDNATTYYKSQATFKELSYNSRCFKANTENETIDFFASLTAFISDAASGITSFAQAVEMDSYQTKFQEIMDHDAKITKDLYAARSLCISQYQGIEEVIRKFHPETLTTTVDKISNTLHVEKHLVAIKSAYQKNDMTKLLDEVCKFFDNASQSEVLENVGASVHKYVTDNPAALDACKSTGKAVYDAIDAFGPKKHDRNLAIGYANKVTNLYLMSEDKKEVDQLKCMIEDDTHQSKLESRIEEAIDSLEAEMKEMNSMYYQLFNNCDSD